MVKIEDPDHSPARLKREDSLRTHLDSQFSKWQVLAGPSDWENYSLGKDGASRYRVQNLPPGFGPGIYELGIAIPRSSSGRDVDSDDIVVVYLGQAENVRSRLQNYGRTGAHLGSGCSTGHSNGLETDCVQKGPGFFEEIFKRGCSIVFRWALVKDKRKAERTEKKLLDTFDYAWNKGGNGPRRQSDILQKLDKVTRRPSNISNRLVLISQDRAGVETEAGKLLASDSVNNLDGKSFLPGIFKCNRSQLRLVARLINICGFTMNGVPCRMPPVSGKKRCQDHEGKRICGSNSRFITGGISNFANDGYPNSITHYDQEYCRTPCGADLRDGTFCRKPAVADRKRCEEHKGMKVNNYLNPKAEERTHTYCKPKGEERLPPVLSRPRAEEKFHTPFKPRAERKLPLIMPKAEETQLIPSVLGTSGARDFHNAAPKIDFSGTKQSQCSNRSFVSTDFSTTCGATLENGSFCRRQPVLGNKRCWQHKGKRVSNSISGYDNSPFMCDILTCGAALTNGSVCTRAPVPGRKRCEQHKWMRASSSFY